MIQGGKGGLPKDLVGFLIVSRIPLLYVLLTENVAFRISSIGFCIFNVVVYYFLTIEIYRHIYGPKLTNSGIL
jgi:hypothetical protein